MGTRAEQSHPPSSPQFDAGRRNFLRRAGGRRAIVVRPPRALPEAAFVECCTRCDGCVDACPPRILVRGAGGFPEIDFRRGGCTLCGACVDRCEPAALSVTVTPPLPWTAVVDDGCFSRQGIACRSCGDQCETGAILFRPLTGGRTGVAVDENLCNGCGSCVQPCPANAVQLRRISQTGELA